MNLELNQEEYRLLKSTMERAIFSLDREADKESDEMIRQYTEQQRDELRLLELRIIKRVEGKKALISELSDYINTSITCGVLNGKQANCDKYEKRVDMYHKIIYEED